ncbi:hypothetical protein N7499_003467 [Penicillium canescens]|uniref:Integral membrane protein n=1 Tax=Penicillium canescens TaxID=5083 RepID=A0AAD6I8V2_PENCN|nr:hypothetical protein N7522_000247 [Penicillium canescens]KAJ6038127.1 hypothetical protein N7460_007898 [Penicillium canescens]KAJ6061212.1 hypothetical protein N7444_001908 [Penicillium canescens]KAJ6090753.1 hypothetical protein N7499_003467 [Penicillium canescens]KAJ6174941.1 hypothetical protein N7485_004746 [Penicillium canescens]
MNFQGHHSRPPPLPPRNPTTRIPITGRPVVPPLPLASKPTGAAQTLTPPAPRNNGLDDPDVITYCPENNILYATAYWYSTPDAPAFEICSYCFASYIRSSQWTAKFERQLKPPDTDRRCRFSTPRMLRLWSQVLRNNDWAYISGYMNHRSDIMDCKGSAPLTTDVGRHWYRLKNNDIDDFAICAACYEDVALATPFGNLFHPNPIGQPAGELWVCDMTEYSRRAMQKLGQTNNWSAFTATVAHMMAMAPCDGTTGVIVSKREWYRPKPYIDDMAICGACYFHYFAASFMESEWEPVRVDLENRGWNTWVCDMSLLSMKVAYIKAMQQKNYCIFWNAAKVILSSPPCPADGAYRGTWYGLRLTGEEVGACSQCYAGIVEPFGFGKYFVRAQSSSNEKRICIFNESAPRREEFLKKFDDAISTRNFSRFQDFAVRFAVLPPCPTYSLVKDRKWYGSNEFLICESCWEEFAKGTSLAAQLPHHGIVLSNACCDLYSHRMRGLWNEACEKGDMSYVTEFAKHRATVYAQTVPRIQVILATIQMRMNQKKALLINSLTLQASDNLVALTKGPSCSRYGNSDIGYGCDCRWCKGSDTVQSRFEHKRR